MTTPETSLITGLANNGPWACVAGLLLYSVLKAWDKDRGTLVALLTDFRKTLDGLTRAVEQLTERMDRQERK